MSHLGPITDPDHRPAPSGKPDIVIQLPQLPAKPELPWPAKPELPWKPVAKPLWKIEQDIETRLARPVPDYIESLKLKRQPTLEKQTSALDAVKKEEPEQEESVAVKVEMKPEKHYFGSSHSGEAGWWDRQLQMGRLEAKLKEEAYTSSIAEAALGQRDITQYLAGRTLNFV